MKNKKTRLYSFIEQALLLCKSIILVGSWAKGCETSDSDIDLVIITDDDVSISQVRKIVQLHNCKTSENSFDCKIYSEAEYMKAKVGKDNFFLWSALKDYEILHGPESWTQVKLIPNMATSLLWKCIEDLEESCRLLDARAEFTGCCFRIFSSLKTIFFAEQLLLDKKIGQKEAYLRSILSNKYSVACDRYKWVSMHLADSTRDIIRVPASIDRQYRENDYKQMYGSGTNALSFAKPRVTELVRALETM